jgi:peptidoglycan/LPS O-acetylase OafA/YrhL
MACVDLPSPRSLLRLPFEKIALWSYGAYLWNVPVMRVLAHRPAPGHWIVAVAVFMVATFAIAAATFYLVEKPGMKLRRFLPAHPANESGALEGNLQEPAEIHRAS